MFLDKIKNSFKLIRTDVSLLVMNQQRLRDRLYEVEKRVRELELETLR